MVNPKVAEIESLTDEKLEVFDIAYNAARLVLEQNFLIENDTAAFADNKEEIAACAR